MKTTLAKPRTYVPHDLPIVWENLDLLYHELLSREINDLASLEKWMLDRNELEAVLQEDQAWRYIQMTCHTDNEEYAENFRYFTTEIEPKIAPIQNELDQKLMANPWTAKLDQDQYFIYLRKVKKALEIFRAENIPLFTDIQLKQQAYQAIVGGMTVKLQGEEYTMQQAATRLLDTDRAVRQEAWEAISAVRLEQAQALEDIFQDLLRLRHQVALNAGFDNYRDYMFVAMGRFDYSVADCEAFHTAVADHVVPVMQELAVERKHKLQLDTLKPWDTQVDPDNLAPLKPFHSGQELIDKTEQAFAAMHTYMGECITTMKANGLFDVESRKGKAPGGYNYPLYESGAPFIFMNATGTMRDLTTMVHEGGHAIHTFISAELAMNDFKDVPSEVAELASMSMELLSMEQWHHFLPNPDDLARAKKEQMDDVLSTLPWVATVDKFQHWLYTNPEHTPVQRTEAWKNIYAEFGHGFADWTSHEEAEQYLWHKQLHIFEVPFYYIEYGFAQLGAISVWKNYLSDRDKTLTQYLAALKLGYTQPIGKIYEAAGIRFDFSSEYVADLVRFVKSERNKN
ncbi:M3 family oligoendopeptidase [Sphingobacterium corticibacter]|uniref:M3 family oligoendopeptidase n=1 Tax=Sphingobacterium corticibacter TaxID=2171749 RepID=A0A2T8HI55_9SPHI|nr:M3 family oligoendopeptidase [Sphingobacterium corticibacter]PVH25127.1 M3 family oligoendopeptidase [Sphingobacterium corticibacter]